MSKKNICMVVYTEYPTDTRVRREAETLAGLPDYNVIIITPKNGVKPERFILEGVELIEVNEPKYCGKNQLRYICSYLRFLLLSFCECTRLFLCGKVDVIHVHNMPNFLVLSGVIPRMFGKKLILDLHDTVPETYAAKFERSGGVMFRAFCLEERLACALADRIICVNKVQKKALVKRGLPKKKITISMNVPDPKLFNLCKPVPSNTVENSAFRLAYHGTVAKRLGLDLILQAVSILKSRIPGIEFHVWGRGGGDLADVLKIANSLGLNNSFRRYDPIPMEKLIPKLLKMDVGIIGNRKNIATELMLPVKMLEYVALEIPVVAPRLKAIQYYFTEDMVSYYEPENVDSMAEAILKLYQNPSLRKKQAEKAKAFLDKYGWERHKYDLINLYKQL